MKKEILYVNHFVKTKIIVFGTILYLKGILTCTSTHLCVYAAQIQLAEMQFQEPDYLCPSL